MEVYKPAKAALDNLSSLSKMMLAASGEGEDVQNLHKTIKSSAESLDVLQARWVIGNCNCNHYDLHRLRILIEY